MERLSINRWSSPWLRHQHLARYQWVSSFTKGGRALDAACGSGYGARILVDNGVRSVDGVDRCLEAVQEARGAATARARFFVADVTELPLPTEIYDALVCLETIEHVADDRKLLSEARRVIRPGGLFICSTPNRPVISPGRNLDDRPTNPFHLREYDSAELATLLRAFFSSVDLYGQTPFPASYVGRLNRIGKRFPTLARRLHQIRKILGLPWECIRRHHPDKLPLDGEPEVLIAVCRR